MFLDYQEKNQCCGCMACSKVCAVSAIEMKQDECGFYYPEVDKKKCVDCGVCETVCPMRKNYVGQSAEPEVYAVRNRNKQVLQKSSSGGMFTALAEWILENQGVIYGVAFDKNFAVRHERADSVEEAIRFRNSKYVESDLSEVYREILTDLGEERFVLLTGTPCQISAVLEFLRVNRADTTRFYTCDNICHGVPSRKLWEDYLAILKKKYIDSDDRITSINMRSKKVSWKKQVMDVQLEKGKIENVIDDFSFNQFFLSLFGNRPSCFHCRYTSYKRVSDFTLGDFWNVENAGVSFDVEGGVNVVLVNTKKGQELFEKLRFKIEVEQVTKEACWQPHLEYSAKAPARQDEFWKEYHSTEEKEAVMRKYMKGSLVTRMIRKVTPLLRKTGLYGLAGKLYKAVFVERSN